jgi:ribosomal protein S18 acetylase RimI-like enzyme
MNNLYKLKKKDLDKSAEVLAKAFLDYPLFKHILGVNHNKENIKILTKFIVKYTVLYGQAYATSPAIEGIILFSDFEDYKFTLLRSLRSGGLSVIKIGKEAGMRFNKYDEFNMRVHKDIINKPHQYIIGIGVDPDKQGQAFGKKLLTSLIKVAEEKNHPCYLETHDEENVQIYKKYGFKVMEEEVIPGTNIMQFSMLKE